MKKYVILILMSTLIISFCSKSIFLEGLSATSVKKGYSQYGPEKILDGDESTSWLTMPGAGPEEGLMFSFNKPLKIKYIEIIPAKSGNKIEWVKLYVNGMALEKQSVTQDVKINTIVKSLYIKITNIEGLKQTASGVEYVSNKSTGIAEIKFYDKEDKELKLAAPIVKSGKIIASSLLQPVAAYNTDFLFDSRRNFGWADGNVKKVGDGEFLKFKFSEETTITKIKIWNGYQRSLKHFEKNETIYKFSFSANGKSAEYTLKYSMAPQEIVLKEPLTSKEFKLDILKARKGTRYKDLVISELRFFDGDNWFIVNTGETEKRKQKLVSSIKSTILENIVDKMKFYRLDFGSKMNITQSIILRSNASFVIYRNKRKNEDKENIVADGNWQIINNSADKATVKIFGRIHTIADLWKNVTAAVKEGSDESNYDPYSGESESDSSSENYRENIKTNTVNLFYDFLEIDSKRIISKKGHFSDMEITEQGY